MQADAATRPPGLADVAVLAGVSHQTVSRVINGHPSVAPATRARVQEVIDALGYRPNAAARALVTGSARTLGLVTVNPSQYGPAQTMIGLERAARDAGYVLLVTILQDGTAEEMREAVETFVSHSVDGIVALSTYDAPAEALAALSPPVPLVAVQVGGAEGRPAVGVDQVEGGRLATRHLLDLGHRTVHHIAGPDDSKEARGRIEGWRAELVAVGAPEPELLTGDWTAASGYAAGRALVARRRAGEEVTAVFTGNDQTALGLLAVLHEAGLHVPGDVSVVGFDDLPESPYFVPPLTTVRQDFAELGVRGVQLVLDRLAGCDPIPDPVPVELVVRASTGPGRHRERAPHAGLPTR